MMRFINAAALERNRLSPGIAEQPQPPLTPEDAAILRVLFQADSVTMTVERIMGKVSLSDKSIRKSLTYLRSLELVEEPVKKKGFCLSTTGLTRAKSLPTDAGANFLAPQMPRR
ncbi:MAG: hypothetical protein ACRELG_19590 [Gemmataceae bacterium]